MKKKKKNVFNDNVLNFPEKTGLATISFYGGLRFNSWQDCRLLKPTFKFIIKTTRIFGLVI